MSGKKSLSTVIVPTDFSRGARRALARVALLPLARRAVVYVVHVIDDRKKAPHPDAVIRACERARSQFIAHARVAGRPAPECVAKIITGTPHVEIIRFARAVGADLVVVGRKGAGHRFRQVLGRTAAQVALKGDFPLLIVDRVPKGLYERPLLAVQFDPCARAIINLARAVVGGTVKSFSGVHAFHVPFEGFIPPGTDAEPSLHHRQCRNDAERQLAAFLASEGMKGVRLAVALRRGEPAGVILREAQRTNADLIVLGTHGRVGIAHALLGSVAEEVVIGARRDVLIARPVRHTFEDV
jgi:nucleotide-binding universal stress UspA family protein